MGFLSQSRQFFLPGACLPIVWLMVAATGQIVIAGEPEIVNNIFQCNLPHLDMRFRQLMLDDYVVTRQTRSPDPG